MDPTEPAKLEENRGPIDLHTGTHTGLGGKRFLMRQEEFGSVSGIIS